MQNRLGLEIKEIIQIRKIPKTISGKFQGYKLAEVTRNGEFIFLKQEIREMKKLGNLDDLVKNKYNGNEEK
ncbi:hypothetical protein [Clostridium saccharoperbutylacetonicum]|uniref:hypothetical protein n=1 Tax=Clostridium saccharoperbutylacetonicum TaxID=36745 RepID=UPI0039EAEA3C